MRRYLIIIQVVLAAWVLAAEGGEGGVAKWKSLKISIPALEKWGTRFYSYSSSEPGGKAIVNMGKVRLSTTVKDDKVVLTDKYELVYRGEKFSMEIIHTCRKDNFLSPVRIESKGEGEEVMAFTASVADGKATVRSEGGRERVRDLPEGTITTAAMMRLVTLVPRKPGASYSYDASLESEEMNLKKNYLLTVMGPETITCGKRKVKCTKFKLSGGGISPVYYWVTEDGVLQRLMMDERKVIELTPVDIR